MPPKAARWIAPPIFLASAFFVFAVAILEKGLNLLGTSLPILNVFPRQLLDWAVALLIFEIALSVRMISERVLTKGEPDRL